MVLAGQTLPITLHSSLQNFGEFQTLEFTPGNVAAFTLTTTDLPPLPFFQPDTVFIILQDLSGIPLPTDDPLMQNALFRVSLTGGADTAQVYPGISGPINGLTFSISGTTGSTGTTGNTGAASPRTRHAAALSRRARPSSRP